MQKDRNDESVDRVLRQVLPELMTTAGSDACVDAETLAAWTGGALPASQAVLVERHVSQCARCQQLMAAFARTEPSLPASAPSAWQRWRLHRVVPLAAATATLAIWLALPANERSPNPQSAQEAVTPVAEEKRAAADARTDSSGANAVAPRAAPPPADADPVGSLASRAPVAGGAASSTPPAEPFRRDQMAAATEAAESSAPASPAPAAPLAQRARVMQERAAALIEIVSPDPARRWRIGLAGRVERSTSSGSTWEAAEMNAPAMLTAGASPDRTVCWLVGRAGAVRLTTDGVRFDAIVFPESVDLVSVRATSATSAVVTTSDGRTFRTDDRGATWIVVP